MTNIKIRYQTDFRVKDKWLVGFAVMQENDYRKKTLICKTVRYIASALL
ncbi:hypothetical protein KBB76_00390 [Candidatus Saccharibacteria bacterium]|jgi:hypothetical protein|nr:hypothetical protein [Candidatus Saccharibacteria bacterium]HOR23092.1 hypothetical protein [Candidatus Saccharibacteria bacterium]